MMTLMTMRPNHFYRKHLVTLALVINTILSLLFQTTTTIITSKRPNHVNHNNYFYIDAFVAGTGPVLQLSLYNNRDTSPMNNRRSEQQQQQQQQQQRSDKDRYAVLSSKATTLVGTTQRVSTAFALKATTRRQSFGDLLGSTLAVPVMVNTASTIIQSPLPAQAADDYPFKVGLFWKWNQSIDVKYVYGICILFLP
jgi:hypothetical protein